MAIAKSLGNYILPIGVTTAAKYPSLVSSVWAPSPTVDELDEDALKWNLQGKLACTVGKMV